MLEKLVCPICKGRLEYNERLKCLNCGQSYEFIEGIPNFLSDELIGKYNMELKNQDLTEEKSFYERMYSSLVDLEDGHCVVYGYDEIYDFMQDVPKGTLLDVGCGAGHHSKDLSLQGYQVTGIDISLHGLLQAKKLAEVNNQSIDFVLGDVENLPFADNYFDVVFCGLVIHHFPKKDKLLKELSRVCKSFFIAFEVNSFDPLSFIRFNIINPTIGIHNITKNQRTVSPFKLKKEMARLGYGNFVVKYVDIHHYLGRYPNSLSSRLLSAYRKVMEIFPYVCRFNKFLMRCTKHTGR